VIKTHNPLGSIKKIILDKKTISAAFIGDILPEQEICAIYQGKFIYRYHEVVNIRNPRWREVFGRRTVYGF
jgi:hypothetical protein